MMCAQQAQYFRAKFVETERAHEKGSLEHRVKELRKGMDSVCNCHISLTKRVVCTVAVVPSGLLP